MRVDLDDRLLHDMLVFLRDDGCGRVTPKYRAEGLLHLIRRSQAPCISVSGKQQEPGHENNAYSPAHKFAAIPSGPCPSHTFVFSFTLRKGYSCKLKI